MGILGLNTATIDLNIDRIEYTEGDIINGRVSLKVQENTKARGVFVTLTAYRMEKRGKSSYKKILHEQQFKLDKEREYRLAETKYYQFTYTLPKTIYAYLKKENGILDKISNFFTHSKNNSIKWEINAKLDQPMALDIHKTIKIIVKPLPEKLNPPTTQNPTQ